MTKDLTAIREDSTLALQVAGFDDKKLASLTKSHAQLKQAAIEKGLKADRERLLKEFTPEKIEKAVLEAMAEGRSSFDLYLNPYTKETSQYWNYKGSLSREVLGELNEELKSSSMLTGVSLGRVDFNFDKHITFNGWTFLSGIVSSVGSLVGVIGVSAAVGASFGLLPAIGAGAATVYGGIKLTKGIAGLVNHHVYDDYYDRGKLTVHFNNPNKSIMGLPGRGLSALANGVRNVMKALNPAKPSARKLEELKSAFSRSYKDAAQGVIEGAQALTKHAENKGLEFSVDIDRFAELSNRQIELVEERYASGGFAQRAERVTTMPLKDIGQAMKDASKMVTIDQEYTSQLQSEFGRVLSGVEANVSYAESEVRMHAISDIGVGLNRLMR